MRNTLHRYETLYSRARERERGRESRCKILRHCRITRGQKRTTSEPETLQIRIHAHTYIRIHAHTYIHTHTKDKRVNNRGVGGGRERERAKRAGV